MSNTEISPSLQEIFTGIIKGAADYKAGATHMPDSVVDRFLLMKCLEAFGEAAGREHHATLSGVLFTHTAYDTQAMRVCVDTLPFLLDPANV